MFTDFLSVLIRSIRVLSVSWAQAEPLRSGYLKVPGGVSKNKYHH